MGAQNGRQNEEKGAIDPRSQIRVLRDPRYPAGLLGPIRQDTADQLGPIREDTMESVQSLQSLSDYIQELVDDESRGAAGRRRSWRDIAGAQQETAREFCQVLKDLIGRSLREGMPRLRMFDNHTLDFKIDSQPANFTACRCTQFQRLRKVMQVSEEEYLESMCGKNFQGLEKSASGKSGSLFLRSHDNRFVLKTIEQHEFDVLEAILPPYLLYLEENPESLLCRFVGAYSLEMRRKKLRIVVMSNVLPGRPDVVYDLKGTTEDRWVDPVCGAVLKDINFHPFTLFFEPVERSRLLRTLRNDAEFLESVGTMDYSLLLGVAADENERFSKGAIRGWLSMDNDRKQPRLFQIGIIDYLQKWTPKKVAAHWLKKPTLGCCHEIDTEPPTIYCNRFYKYMDRKMQIYVADDEFNDEE